MLLNFNDKEGTKLDIAVEDDSYRYRTIMGEHALTLHFSMAAHVEIPVGAWVEFEGERYKLEKPGSFKKKSSRNFEYTLVMESAQAGLRKYKFRNVVDNRLVFSNTARPKEHLKMLIDNLNLRESGWEAGECIDAVEKVISFNHTSCADALSQIANEFNTEYEIVGKKIHLRKVEYNKNDALKLSYGKGKGFRPGLGRSNYNDTQPIEVLFVQGGEQNLDPSKYGSQIGGKISFVSGSSGLENLDEWDEKQAQIDAAQQAAADANQAIGQMNDDTFLDQIEKHATRTIWENVNGIPGLTEEGTSGSYYTTLESMAGGGEAQMQAFTLSDSEQFMVQK